MNLLKLLSINLLLLPVISFSQSPGGVSAGLQTWLRADIGVTGTTPVTGWANQFATGTTVYMNGAPNLNIVSTGYNYNPYIDFTAPVGTLNAGVAANRQCVRLTGFTGPNGLNYTSLFFAFHLTNLSRSYTHCATIDGISNGPPPNGSLHGGDNVGSAAIKLDGYDTDYDGSSPLGTWERNGASVLSTAAYLTTKHLLSANRTGGVSTTLNSFLGGQQDNLPFEGHNRDWRGPAAEIIGYTTGLSALNRQKIDSYMGIKYGITLAKNYLSTSGGNIFTVAAPYNNNIIGIGRDDAEALTQRQSHNDDDLVRVYLNTLTGRNSTNTGSFTSDISYVMTGANTGSLCATAASNLEMPVGLPSCTLYSRMEREWKVQRTNMNQNFNMDVRIAACGAPGSVNVAHLRLLVDDDGNFSNGGTQCYYNGDGSGIVFTYTNPTITISNINTANHIANNTTRFITIASISSLTPLPIELINFDATYVNNRTVDLTWNTASEVNCNYFTLYKSTNGIDWSYLARTNGNGNSVVEQNYLEVDRDPKNGVNYYKLEQTDFDGTTTEIGIRSINVAQEDEMEIYPNPSHGAFYVSFKSDSEHEVNLFDMTGRKVWSGTINLKGSIETSNLTNGMYFIRVGSEERKLLIENE